MEPKRRHLRLVGSPQPQPRRPVDPADHVAGSSWRAMTSEHWWLFGDAVIGSDGRGSGGRQDWEVYLHGKLVAIRHSLSEAKAIIEDQYGPQRWQPVDLAKVKVDHPYFGETTEFTAPTRVWVVDPLVDDGT